MNELALFAGGGGGILGGKLLGWRTVCAVEINAFCARRLMQRQNERHLPPFPIWDDVCTFDGRPWSGVVDVVSGGFPCQDISAAGTGAGLDGERSGLWVEMARIIGEVRPAFCFVENSPMLTSRGLGTVLGDLAALGYDAEWGVLGAVDVGAPHKRERCWIVAYASGLNWDAWRTKSAGQQRQARIADGRADVADSYEIGRGRRAGMLRESGRPEPENSGDAVPYTTGQQHEGGAHEGRGQGQGETAEIIPADTLRHGLENRLSAGYGSGPGATGEESKAVEGSFSAWWATEPDVGRVANGVAARVDRLQALGNGQVPQCAAEAWLRLSARFGL